MSCFSILRKMHRKKGENMDRKKENDRMPESNVSNKLAVLSDQEIEPIVVQLDDTHVLIEQISYEIVENYRAGFNLEALNERYHDILARYDYIVGDWGHEKLRLKGFFRHGHRLATPERDIDYLQDYLYEYCNFGCQYFVLERDPNAKPVTTEEQVIPKRKKNKNHYRRQPNASSLEKKESKRQMVSHKKENRVMKQSKKQRNNRKESTQQKQTDFNLKTMVHKESLQVQPSAEQQRQRSTTSRAFSMKEVEQPKVLKKNKRKPTKNNYKKRFDIREKQLKRGK